MIELDRYRAEPGKKIKLSEWATDDSQGIERDAIHTRYVQNIEAIGALQQVLWYTSAGDSTISMLTRVAPAIGVIVLSGVVFLVGAWLAISRWS